MIIGISGVARAGKDSIADILTKEFGFKKMAFADPLKKICSKVFQIPLQCFYDDKLKDLAFIEPEIIDVYHIERLVTELEGYTSVSNDQIRDLTTHGCGKELKSPREILQFVGTDLVRTYVKDSVWLDIFITEAKRSEGHLVCSDARFPNEREIIKSLGGTNMIVIREGLNSSDSHASENSLGTEADYDIVVKNDAGLSDLHREITTWYTLKTSR